MTDLNLDNLSGCGMRERLFELLGSPGNDSAAAREFEEHLHRAESAADRSSDARGDNFGAAPAPPAAEAGARRDGPRDREPPSDDDREPPARDGEQAAGGPQSPEPGQPAGQQPAASEPADSGEGATGEPSGAASGEPVPAANAAEGEQQLQRAGGAGANVAAPSGSAPAVGKRKALESSGLPGPIAEQPAVEPASPETPTVVAQGEGPSPHAKRNAANGGKPAAKRGKQAPHPQAAPGDSQAAAAVTADGDAHRSGTGVPQASTEESAPAGPNASESAAPKGSRRPAAGVAPGRTGGRLGAHSPAPGGATDSTPRDAGAASAAPPALAGPASDPQPAAGQPLLQPAAQKDAMPELADHSASAAGSEGDAAGPVRSAGSRARQPVAPADGPGTSVSEQVGRVRFVQRVARAFQAVGDHGGSIRLRLHPPELGSLRLDLTLRNGVLTARLETETAAARSLLVDNLPALRDRLAEHHIRVERFDVDLADRTLEGSPQRPGDHPQPQDQPGRSAPPSPRRESAPEPPAVRTVAVRPGQESGFDVII